MSDLSCLSSQVKINDTKYQLPCITYIFIPHLRPRKQTYRRPFPQIDCFSFSKYTANNNNREPVGKSERMKNAEITFMRRAIPYERIPKQTLSLETLKWLQASR